MGIPLNSNPSPALGKFSLGLEAFRYVLPPSLPAKDLGFSFRTASQGREAVVRSPEGGVEN